MYEPLQAWRPAIDLDPLLSALGRLAPLNDARGGLPEESLTLLRGSGLAAIGLPAKLGGPQASPGVQAWITHAIAGQDPALGLIFALHLKALHRLYRYSGAEALKPEIAEEVLRTGALANVLTADAGAPTLATETPTGWRLSGRKAPVTAAAALRWFVTPARLAPSGDSRGVFVLKRGASGLRIEPSWTLSGMRGTASDTVVFDDAEIGRDARLDTPQDAGEIPGFASFADLLIAAVYDAIARSAARWLYGHLAARGQGRAGPEQAARVGEMERDLLANALLLDALAAERLPAQQSAGAKCTVVDTAHQIVEAAIALGGTAALDAGSPIERARRDVAAGRLHPPFTVEARRQDAANALARAAPRPTAIEVLAETATPVVQESADAVPATA